MGSTVVTLSQMSLGGYATVTLADAAMSVSLKDSGVDPAKAVAVLRTPRPRTWALTRVAHLSEGVRGCWT